MRIHPSDRVADVVCHSFSESGGKFVVVKLTNDSFIAAWEARYVACDTLDELKPHLNGFERELLEKGLKRESKGDDRQTEDV